MDKNRLIGKSGKLPWHIQEDLAWFKKQTMGHPVVMGRLTWLSLPAALSGRRNIVLSSDPDFTLQQVEVVSNSTELEKLIAWQDAFIIGGASVFRQFLPKADALYIAHLDAEYEGDTYFPVYNESEWLLIHQEEQLSTSGVLLKFCKYIRKSNRVVKSD